MLRRTYLGLGAGLSYGAVEPLNLKAYRIRADGQTDDRITDGAGEILRGVAPDGRSILVARSSESGTWMMSIPSGSFTRIAEQRAAALYSPDGRSLLMLRMAPEEDRVRLGLQIVPVGQTKPSATLAAPDAFDFDSLRWAPSGDAITYLADRDGAVNVWLQPLAGGPARRLTDFKVGRVFEYDWFPDGKHLVLSGDQIFTDVVLISEFR